MDVLGTDVQPGMQIELNHGFVYRVLEIPPQVPGSSMQLVRLARVFGPNTASVSMGMKEEVIARSCAGCPWRMRAHQGAPVYHVKAVGGRAEVLRVKANLSM